MADIKEFVVNDRRKFTAEGELRPDAPPSEPKPPRPETLQRQDESDTARLVEAKGPQAVPSPAAEHASSAGAEPSPNEEDLMMPPAPTAEQAEQAKRAYEATVDRLETAIRATNPGMEHAPEISFERVIQSLYMQALLQLGGGAGPGQQPQVDILGARQTIDMVTILAAKTEGNRTEAESKLLETALFELHMGFLEVTQALSRQAAARPTGAGMPPPPGGGPSIVR